MSIFTHKASAGRFDVLVTCQSCTKRLEFGLYAQNGHDARKIARSVLECQSWMFYAQRTVCDECKRRSAYRVNGIYAMLYNVG